jgi:CheY-like chemotaxis protein
MRTILLADDSPTIRRLVTQTFADANFKIAEVSNGDAAIKRFEELKPDIVLTDIYMPGKNGYEVCSYVRSHQTLGSTPVILLVGAFDAFDEERAKKAGAAANITKPFEPGALIELVTSILPAEAAQAELVTKPEDVAPEPESRLQLRMEDDTPSMAAPAQASVAPPTPAAAPAPAPVSEPLQLQAEARPAERSAAAGPSGEEEDLLGLQGIFKEEAAVESPSSAAISDADVDRIADRVIQKLSAQVIQSIAWDIVPDIVEKIVREELKRSR